MRYFKNIVLQISKVSHYAVLAALCILLITSTNTQYYNQEIESVVSVENAYEEASLVIDEFINCNDSERISIHAIYTVSVSNFLKAIALPLPKVIFCHSKLYIKYCQWLI